MPRFIYKDLIYKLGVGIPGDPKYGWKITGDFDRMTRNAIYETNNWRKLHGLPMIRKGVRP